MMIKSALLFAGILLVLALLYNGIPVLKTEGKETTIFLRPDFSPLTDNYVEFRVPAVTEDDKGILAKVTIEVVPGSGRTLMNIDNILFFEDTQNSIRLARAIAENVTGVELVENDIIYSVRTDASAIEGSSAGAAMTIGTIALLEGRELNQSVAMTGFVRPDGRVGKVSNVLEKAKVSKDNGYTLFLVPPGQEVQEEITKEEVCRRILFKDVCNTVVKESMIDIQKAANITVIEVSDIREAVGYIII